MRFKLSRKFYHKYVVTLVNKSSPLAQFSIDYEEIDDDDDDDEGGTEEPQTTARNHSKTNQSDKSR